MALFVCVLDDVISGGREFRVRGAALRDVCPTY